MFVDLTPENLADETLCCIVRMKKLIPVWKPSGNGWRNG